ncbi:CGNR zinc finger domain-containing protein [Kribbella qitaiheensis]|uniref:CGNR zinc finger domain-containing protein n=1 Tax=Kribbella qitaiheensis TaxID=1544730 RepID=UPI00360BD9E0
MGYQPELIGGHLLLDLVNTVSWRLDDSRWIDRLSTPADLDDWCAAVGLSAGRRAKLEDVTQVRETAYLVVLPLARGDEPAKVELQALQELLVDALSRAKPTGLRPLDWTTHDLPGTLALSAARLLEHEDLSRLRECQDDDCGWLFMDRSKNGSRRWCSSRDCGNRARAKRHYQRVRAVQS